MKAKKTVKPNLPYYLYKTANCCYRFRIPLLPFLIRQFMRVVFSAIIPYEAKMGRNIHFGYNGLGIVIHRKCVIGDNVHFFQQITLGGGDTRCTDNWQQCRYRGRSKDTWWCHNR